MVVFLFGSCTFSQVYFPPKEFVYISDSSYLYDKFYPIGWSKDGKFAYITEPADEATGFYFWDLCIISPDSGKMIYLKENTIEDEKFDRTIDGLFKLKKDSIELILKTFKIEQQTFSNFNDTLIGVNTPNRYLLGKKACMLRSPLDFMDVITSYDIMLFSGDEKSRTVFSKDIPNSYDIEMDVCGSFSSKDKKFNAIVYYLIQRGYEGPPHVARIKLLGISGEFIDNLK